MNFPVIKLTNDVQFHSRLRGSHFRDVKHRPGIQLASRHRGSHFPAIKTGSEPLRITRSRGSHFHGANIFIGKLVDHRRRGPNSLAINHGLQRKTMDGCKGQISPQSTISTQRNAYIGCGAKPPRRQFPIDSESDIGVADPTFL